MCFPVTIGTEIALARDDISREWIERCQTPKNTKKELTKVTTLNDAIDLLAPSLYKIKGIKSEEYVLSWIELWIIDLQVNLNIKNKMNEDMIYSCSEAILDQYGYLTIPDIKNVFTEALSGQYGEFYERLSIDKVLKWISDYAERRSEEFMERNVSDAKYRESNEAGKRSKNISLSANDMQGIIKGKENG